MRRLLHELVGITIIVGSFTKERPIVVAPEPPVTKKIFFEIYTQKDYSDASYDNALLKFAYQLQNRAIRTIRPR